jgi:hypothetical protein
MLVILSAIIPVGFIILIGVIAGKILTVEVRFFGLSYAMDWGYKGWNPYIERYLAIFVNCF